LQDDLPKPIQMARKLSNQVRIIGGEHRGRKLPFPDLPGLRPSGDRVRETLFNWLQPVLLNARCLDLFAGSGALGLEAASRGAGEVVMLDIAPPVIRQLEANRDLLGLTQVKLVKADALLWLDQDSRPFDVVFLDPPFASNLLGEVCKKLLTGGWLAADALVYLEDDAGRGFPTLPENWQWHRQQRAGQVCFGLARQ
jgi:16S rRNA (guanine966-N2)-methyltransferase